MKLLHFLVEKHQIHIYTHTHIYIHTYIYTHTYIQTYIHTTDIYIHIELNTKLTTYQYFFLRGRSTTVKTEIYYRKEA